MMVLSDTSRLSSIISVALSEKNHIISRITFSKVEIEIKMWFWIKKIIISDILVYVSLIKGYWINSTVASDKFSFHLILVDGYCKFH